MGESPTRQEGRSRPPKRETTSEKALCQTRRVPNAVPVTDLRRLHVKPMRDLWREGWLAFAAMSLPPFAACYLLTAASEWPVIAVAHAACTLLFAAVAGRLRGAGVIVDADGIHERAYLRSTVFTPLHRVKAVLIIPVHRSLLNEVTHQLFVIDGEGATLLRMRGQLWHPRDLRAVAHHFDVPVRVFDPPLTWSELRRSPYGRNLERWERHPVLTASGLVVLGIAVITPAVAAGTALVSG